MSVDPGQRRERPRSFADLWDSPGTPRPPTTVANPVDGAGVHHRPPSAEDVAAAPGVDRWGGIDLSPDGSEVAFAWDRSGALEIYSAPLGGDRIIQLTGAGARSVAPRWSRDGRWIAFLRGGDGRTPTLWIVDRDGEHEREVGPPDPAHGVTLSAEGTPQWSPNTAPAVLAAAGVAHVAGSARWSPDRAMIAFATPAHGWTKIAFAHVQGDAVTRVEIASGTPFDDTDPVWRPDGRGVVYRRYEHGHVTARRVFTVSHADDAVIDVPGWVFSPQVGPDSETAVAILVEPHGADVVVRPKGAVALSRITRSGAPG